MYVLHHKLIWEPFEPLPGRKINTWSQKLIKSWIFAIESLMLSSNFDNDFSQLTFPYIQHRKTHPPSPRPETLGFVAGCETQDV